MRKVVIGSRESKLAVVQSEMVRDYIRENKEGLIISPIRNDRNISMRPIRQKE